MTKQDTSRAAAAAAAMKAAEQQSNAVKPGKGQKVKGAFSSGRTLFRPEGPQAQAPQQVAPSKGSLKRLTIKQMPKALSDFTPGISKDSQIAEWLVGFISKGFQKGTLNESMLLPLKKELSEYLGVSIGTVQNAIRAVEDEGWVESKQRIGTMLRNRDEAGEGSRVRKQTSKRDQAVVAIQQYIVREGLKVDELLPSSREMAKVIDSAPNTTRLAMEFLAHEGILEAMGNRGKKPNWLLRQIPEIEVNSNTLNSIKTDTLIDQLERDIKQMIANHYEVNSKLPSHQELATYFNVSIKTVHDAMRRLVTQGFVHAKRGRYGSYVTRLPMNLIDTQAVESLFVPVGKPPQSEFYFYEKAQKELESRIGSTYQSGDRLPSLQALSEEMDLPVNAIRRALKSFEGEGKVSFKRGRYGGAVVK